MVSFKIQVDTKLLVPKWAYIRTKIFWFCRKLSATRVNCIYMIYQYQFLFRFCTILNVVSQFLKIKWIYEIWDAVFQWKFKTQLLEDDICTLKLKYYILYVKLWLKNMTTIASLGIVIQYFMYRNNFLIISVKNQKQYKGRKRIWHNLNWFLLYFIDLFYFIF